MPSPQLQTIIQVLKALPARDDIPLEEIRAGFEQLATFFPVAADVKCEPVDVDGMRGEWITAPGASPEHTVLWLHGGGYVLGSLNTHRDLAARVSRAAAARVLLVEYRLAPEHVFPAAVEDAVEAYRWARQAGFQRLNLAIQSVGAPMMILLLLLLVPRHGSVGAALAQLVAYLVIVAATIVTGRRRLGRSVPLRALLAGGVGALVGGVVLTLAAPLGAVPAAFLGALASLATVAILIPDHARGVWALACFALPRAG